MQPFLSRFSIGVVNWRKAFYDRGRAQNDDHQLTAGNMKPPISLVYWASGSGIEKDLNILKKALEANGYAFDEIVTRARESRKERILKAAGQALRLFRPRPVQIHVEQIHREQFQFAKHNLILPNQEFTDPRIFRKIRSPFHILCKTQYACSLFSELDLPHSFLGFTSEDRLLRGREKNFRGFLHVAGKSRFKGTSAVVEAWRRHPEWPTLTLVQSKMDCYGVPIATPAEIPNIRLINEWVPEHELKALQNECGIHLCPSEMEGFGHYINEGLSAGAVVLTTNAPPMSELVSSTHGILMEAVEMKTYFMGQRWGVSPESLEQAVDTVLQLPLESLERMSSCARQSFMTRDSSFRKRIRTVLDSLPLER